MTGLVIYWGAAATLGIPTGFMHVQRATLTPFHVWAYRVLVPVIALAVLGGVYSVLPDDTMLRLFHKA